MRIVNINGFCSSGFTYRTLPRNRPFHAKTTVVRAPRVEGFVKTRSGFVSPWNTAAILLGTCHCTYMSLHTAAPRMQITPFNVIYRLIIPQLNRVDDDDERCWKLGFDILINFCFAAVQCPYTKCLNDPGSILRPIIDVFSSFVKLQ